MDSSTILSGAMLLIHLFNLVLKFAGDALSEGFNFFFYIELLIKLGVQNW
jgi:hypothetical protein